MKPILKHKLYPAVLGAIVLGLAIWLMNQFDISVQMESGVPPVQPSPETSSEGAISPSSPGTGSLPNGSVGSVSGSDSQSQPPSPTLPTSTPSVSPTASTPQTSVQTLQLGGVRISNQTDYPIRVVLSQVVSPPTPAPNADGRLSQYGEPIHWDFAPQEGNTNGLLLALPDRDLLLQSGDVLVAFAQDGSRRYWGPYVVGSSSTPLWNQAGKEWQLKVQTP